VSAAILAPPIPSSIVSKVLLPTQRAFFTTGVATPDVFHNGQVHTDVKANVF
jgi:hypothetical protein